MLAKRVSTAAFITASDFKGGRPTWPRKKSPLPQARKGRLSMEAISGCSADRNHSGEPGELAEVRHDREDVNIVSPYGREHARLSLRHHFASVEPFAIYQVKLP